MFVCYGCPSMTLLVAQTFSAVCIASMLLREKDAVAAALSHCRQGSVLPVLSVAEDELVHWHLFSYASIVLSTVPW